MSMNTRRRALVGAGLLSAVALLALVPMLQDRATEAPGDADATPAAVPAADVAKRLSTPMAATPDSSRSLAAAASHEAYLSDRIMIRPADGEDPRLIAADYGGALFRKPGKSGWVAIAVPTGTHSGGAVEALRADSRVRQAGPVGIVRGAATTLEDIQYKAHDVMEVRTSSVSSSIVVAVIDSGVAYENYTDDGVSYVRASTLSNTTFRYPYDFVNDDAHPNDDHMHGTHIASIIAAKPQYSGDMRGVAPGVSIMPIKVLDETNSGNEADLVDGIWHAIDNGAEIINLSLAFGESYVPSAALQEALREAYEAGIVVIAAAGNDAADYQAWPAASPYVLGVAAACPSKTVAEYSNKSPGVHVTGIGGCMTEDKNSDGYPDGILGQTIVDGDPSDTQYVLWGGTSQAAAMVSGTAARYLSSEDGRLSTIPTVLQDTAISVGNGGMDKGTGAGIPTRAGEDELEDARAPKEYLVAVLPYLHRSGSSSGKPAALINVLDDDGDAGPKGELWNTLKGSTSQQLKCTTSSGQCHFIGNDSVSLTDSTPDGWSIQVDAFTISGKSQVVQPAMFGTDGLEVMVAAMQENEDTAGLPLGIYWPDNTTPHSGVTTAEAYAFVDSGVGFASSPLGGVGFASSPLGLSSFKLVAMDGVGFASSPLGLDAFDIYHPSGGNIDLAGVGFSSSPLGGVGFSSSPLNLATGDGIGVSLSGTEIGDVFDSGGWTIGSGGFAIGTGLIGASMIDVTPSAVGAGIGDGWEICD